MQLIIFDNMCIDYFQVLEYQALPAAGIAV